MRGVNKLVVEIRDPDSRYFDRCLLFLRPQNRNTPQNELNDEAQRLLGSVLCEQKKRRPLLVPVLVLIAAAAVGGILIGVFLL